MAKREYLDDSKRAILERNFGKQDWRNPNVQPSVTTDTFGKGWRWTFSETDGWYLKNKKGVADVVRHNVLNPIKGAVNSKITPYIAAAAAPLVGVDPSVAYAIAQGARKSKVADYGVQKFEEKLNPEYKKSMDTVDYDFKRVGQRFGEATLREYAKSKATAAAKLIDGMQMFTEEPGQVKGSTVNRSSGQSKQGPYDPWAAAKKWGFTGGGDRKNPSKQTLFKPYGHNTGKAVVVTASHLAPESISVYDANTKKLITRVNKPRNVGNGGRANWDLGAPGPAFQNVIISLDGTGKTMLVSDGRARWSTENL